MSILIFSHTFLCLDYNHWNHSGASVAPVSPDNEELTMLTLYKQITVNLWAQWTFKCQQKRGTWILP